jgi:hypothetical protein
MWRFRDFRRHIQGILCLLRIKEDDYPGTTTIEQWPSWTAPVLSWAKSQGGMVGYAHSGWGLEPMQATYKLPIIIPPKMDGIGANEYIVTVTENLVDFFSAGDTPAPWELNMYYHTLNCGFKTRLSGETDFPCITDARVGRREAISNPKMQWITMVMWRPSGLEEAMFPMGNRT